MKGIIPVCLRHFIVAQSSRAGLSALTVIPIVEQVPSISMLSLIDEGTPKRGGKNFQVSHSSSMVQFFFLVLLRSSSHSLALLRAYQKYSSVMMQFLRPIVHALSPQIAISCSEVILQELSSSTSDGRSNLVSLSILSGVILCFYIIPLKMGRYFYRLWLRLAMVRVLISQKLVELPIQNKIKIYLQDTMLVVLLASVCLITGISGIQVVVDANKQPYAALRQVLGSGAIQNSDACDDKVAHIGSIMDPILNRNVLTYSLHVHNGYKDGDRCNGDYSRQRCESSVQSSSPSWMKGDKGMTFSFAWKLYLDKDFQQTYQFCHLHQIKLDGANVGTPNLTLTARANMQLQNQGNILAKVPIQSFKGQWVQIRQKITYNTQGCVDLSIHRIRDGYQLMSYSGCTVRLQNNGIMIRPKFGFYRSLQKPDGMKDETIRMVDLCIGQNDSCHYNAYGVKMQPEVNLSLGEE